jgi:thioredoxin
MGEKILREKGLVVRHSVVELIEHWAIALSGLALVLSGMFEMPMANRYYISSVPGLAWSADYIVSLKVHYAASIVFVAAALFHAVYHGLRGDRGMIPRKGDIRTSIEVMKSFFGTGKEPPFHKYLPEQRLAYIGMAAIIAMLIVSGLVKTYKNIYAPDMSYAVVLWATWVHNIGFVLFVLAFLAHMAAIVLKPNRPMLRGILTGAVRLDYAEHRHPLWIGELEKTSGGIVEAAKAPEPAQPVPKAEETPQQSDDEKIEGDESMSKTEMLPQVTDGNFDQQVLKAEKPCLVDFWAPWCGPCKAVGPVLEDLAGVYEDRVHIVKLNIDENPNTPMLCRVRSVPTLILYRGGKELDRIVGLAPKAKLEELIEKGFGA